MLKTKEIKKSIKNSLNLMIKNLIDFKVNLLLLTFQKQPLNLSKYFIKKLNSISKMIEKQYNIIESLHERNRKNNKR